MPGRHGGVSLPRAAAATLKNTLETSVVIGQKSLLLTAFLRAAAGPGASPARHLAGLEKCGELW